MGKQIATCGHEVSDGGTPSEFIYAQTETFEKVVKLINVQTQRFQKERLTEL